MARYQTQVDFRVVNHGTIAMVTPVTEAAKRWVQNNLDRSCLQYLGAAFAVEPRYLGTILEGISEVGLDFDNDDPAPKRRR